MLLLFNLVVMLSGRANQSGVYPHRFLTLLLSGLGAVAALVYLACCVAFFYYRGGVGRSDTSHSPDGWSS